MLPIFAKDGNANFLVKLNFTSEPGTLWTLSTEPGCRWRFMRLLPQLCLSGLFCVLPACQVLLSLLAFVFAGLLAWISSPLIRLAPPHLHLSSEVTSLARPPSSSFWWSSCLFIYVDEFLWLWGSQGKNSIFPPLYAQRWGQSTWHIAWKVFIKWMVLF